MALTIQRPSDGVAVVVLDRPDQLNALDGALFDALPSAFEAIAEEASTHVVILTGAGRGFCAGADLTDRDGPPADLDGATAWMRRVQRGPLALHRMPQPTIAAVNGPAAGGGLGLALACDIRIAGPAATFSAPFVRMGLGPDFGSSYTLPRAVGMDRALQMLLTGRRVGAAEAHALGLVTELADDALTAAVDLARQIAAMPPEATRAIKATLRRAAAGDYEAAVSDLEPRTQGGAIAHPEFARRVRDWHAAKAGRPR